MTPSATRSILLSKFTCVSHANYKVHAWSRTTKIQYGTNEWFTFDVQLGDDTIHFDIYDEDVQNDDMIGSGKVELKNVFDDGKLDEWVEIRVTGSSFLSGEIHITMDFKVSFFIISHLKKMNNSIYVLALLNVNIV